MKNKKIIDLRKKIDKIDRKLFNLLEKRLDLCKKIAKEKIKNNFKIKDSKREKNLIKDKIRNFNLRKEFINKIYKIIFDESKNLQKNEKIL